MIKKTIILIVSVLTLAGCHRAKYNAQNLTVDELMSHEWISFHVDKIRIEGKNMEPTIVGYDIVIHNVNDSVQEIASFHIDGESYMITPQWAKYVSTQNCDIAHYRNLPNGKTES